MARARRVAAAGGSAPSFCRACASFVPRSAPPPLILVPHSFVAARRLDGRARSQGRPARASSCAAAAGAAAAAAP
eukprot:scaffold600_cov385-Prasinococcus_capsulatus_cf.AAC.16